MKSPELESSALSLNRDLSPFFWTFFFTHAIIIFCPRPEGRRPALRFFSVLSDYARVLRNWKVRYAPQSPDQPVHARFTEACRKLDETEYYLDILCAGDSHERAEVVQHQMEDGKLDRLRRRLEEIHKEELEDGNDTAGVA